MSRRSPLIPMRPRPPKIQHLSLPADRRTLVISDVHGNLPYLQGLLEKTQFSEDDVLIIDGDLLEKGPYSLKTLRYVMELSKTHEIHAVSGNCDWWVPLLFELGSAEDNRWYLNAKPYCLLRQMCAELGIPVSPDMDFIAARDACAAAFPAEFDFLRALPEIIETENFIFVHGGLPEGDPATWDAWKCMKCDNFMATPRRFNKWVIVGHWPVMLYHENIVDANPVIDYEKKIVSIDGGSILKDDGQLNALILPRSEHEDFSFVAYDPFPVGMVKAPQTASEKSYYIRWGDAEVQVLARGAEFSRIRHVRTGYEMDVLTKYLCGDGDRCTVNDCTDYVLPLLPGDTVSVVETTSRGYFVKLGGVSGWYFGELEF